MNYLVVYPGRFHIFHRGHKAVYDYLTTKYGNNVYISTSDVQDPETSPFSYSDKVAMLTKMGVPAGHILKVANPYRVDEYTQNLPDAANTVLIFAVGNKDMQTVKDPSGKTIQRPRFSFAPKKDGSPSALQPLPDNLKKCRPITDKVAYVDVIPTQNFKILGQDANSASQVRKLYRDGNDADRLQIITDLYGTADAELKDIFDQKLAPAQGQIVTYGKEIIDGGDSPPVQALRERKEKLLTKINEMREQLSAFRQLTSNLDYIDEKRSQKK